MLVRSLEDGIEALQKTAMPLLQADSVSSLFLDLIETLHANGVFHIAHLLMDFQRRRYELFIRNRYFCPP